MKTIVSTLVLTSVLGALASAQTTQQFTASSPLHAWQPHGGAGSFLVNNYQYDDGVSENSIGITGGTLTTIMMCWLTRYDAVGGSDTITTVSVAYGTALFPGGTPPNGAPSNVAVWEDPNNDGNPADAVLLTQVATTIQNADTDILNPVAVPPVVVSGVFFVGAFCPSLAGPPAQSEFPASLDLTSQSLGRTWAVAANPVTAFTPGNLSNPAHNVPLTEMSTVGAGFDGVWLLRAEGSASAPTVYCTAKVNALGCTPSIGSTGSPSATATSGFVVTGSNVRNNKNGLLFYGITGQASSPFQGGTLCVKTPIRRTPAINSGGAPAPANDCSGIYSIDMNSFAQGLLGGTPLLALKTVGTTVNCQFWGRDPGFLPPNNTTLTDGLQYVTGP